MRDSSRRQSADARRIASLLVGYRPTSLRPPRAWRCLGLVRRARSAISHSPTWLLDAQSSMQRLEVMSVHLQGVEAEGLPLLHQRLCLEDVARASEALQPIRVHNDGEVPQVVV